MAYTNSIGIIQNMKLLFNEYEKELFDQMVDAGIETVQLLVNSSSYKLMTEENAEKILKMAEGKVRITSLWAGWHTGPSVWNFIDGPGTLGLVPDEYREARIGELKLDADFAHRLGVTDIASHVGFIPEQPCYHGYHETVEAVKQVAEHCAKYDMYFNFETGQETPTTLMRFIGDVGADNLGVNLDPANLILYGRANPVDALDLYGSRVRGVHVKDGNYPKDNFYELGKETVVGEGKVNFPVFIPKLLSMGYKGDLYIEREIAGKKRADDITKTISYVRELMK